MSQSHSTAVAVAVCCPLTCPKAGIENILDENILGILSLDGSHLKSCIYICAAVSMIDNEHTKTTNGTRKI